MKVYVVTQGAYSDYGIVAIFSTREQAELKCATLYDDNNQIAEWEVDAETLQGEVAKAYEIVYSAYTGDIVQVNPFKYVIRGSTCKSQKLYFSMDSAPHYKSYMTYTVEAETEDQARKIFHDKYIEDKYKFLMDEMVKLKEGIDSND